MSMYPRYDDGLNKRANAVPFDPYDSNPVRLVSADVHDAKPDEFDYGSSTKPTHEDSRSISGAPSKTTLVEDDDDPFSQQPKKTAGIEDENSSRPLSRRYEDLGANSGTLYKRRMGN